MILNETEEKTEAIDAVIFPTQSAPLSTTTPQAPPAIEMSFSDLTQHQREMVTQSLNHHLAMHLMEKKHLLQMERSEDLVVTWVRCIWRFPINWKVWKCMQEVNTKIGSYDTSRSGWIIMSFSQTS